MPTLPAIPLAKGDRWMDVSEVASLFGVDPETVHRWARDQVLKSFKPTPKRRVFKKTDVNVLLSEKGLPTI